MEKIDGKDNYLEFEKNFVETLNKHAPKKTKTFRGNHKPHINKTLRKAIMKRRQYLFQHIHERKIST